ncbi:hypothetical protein [Gemmiger sp.]|uniref:hypothetical protein n=1 Tax=Gemmiger sp. TaxID=2049027 RepID=UPI002E7A028E|nr:hypothetical protein [Gemmiger sp.]MEE1423433.1 hypothetical protein [Gemmiger sp.]
MWGLAILDFSLLPFSTTQYTLRLHKADNTRDGDKSVALRRDGGFLDAVFFVVIGAGRPGADLHDLLAAVPAALYLHNEKILKRFCDNAIIHITLIGIYCSKNC